MPNISNGLAHFDGGMQQRAILLVYEYLIRFFLYYQIN